MPTFPSDPQRVQETLEVTVDFLGGQFYNYVKPILELTSVVFVKQAGIEIPYAVEDIDHDGKLEIVVGDVFGTVLVSYNFADQGDDEPYVQALSTITYNPSGTPNNYVTVTDYPIITVHTPATGSIDGIANQIIRIGGLYSENGKIDVDYTYDAGQLGALARQALEQEEEQDSQRESITSMYSNKTAKLEVYDINLEFADYYYRGYDYTKIWLEEKQNYANEDIGIGSWNYVWVPPQPNPTPPPPTLPGYYTYQYVSGNQTLYQSAIAAQQDLYVRELITLAIQGYKAEVLIDSTTLTVSGAGINFVGTRSPFKACDGQLGEENAFQSDNVNPVTIKIQLEQPEYITKIRINASPEEVLENIESVIIADDYSGTNSIELLISPQEAPIETSYEWYDVDATQRWRDQYGVPLEDANGQEQIYLVKKQWVFVTMSRALSEDVWLNEVEIYKANYDNLTMQFIDGTWALYNSSSYWSTHPNWGLDIGFDTNPPTGRATWIEERKTLTAARRALIDEILGLGDNISLISQVQAEGDINYIYSQNKLWREKFEETYDQQYGMQRSINSSAVEVVKINDELTNYARYL